MHKLTYRGPSGETVENPNHEWLRSVIQAFPSEYWRQGSGGATLQYTEEGLKVVLLVLPNAQHGFYLKYISGEETWLSLRDADKLSEVAECGDEWYASVGLFLSKEQAWLAIEEFLNTGARTDRIHWIRPEAVPEDGNW